MLRRPPTAASPSRTVPPSKPPVLASSFVAPCICQSCCAAPAEPLRPRGHSTTVGDIGCSVRSSTPLTTTTGRSSTHRRVRCAPQGGWDVSESTAHVCVPVQLTIDIVGGKWKPLILWFAERRPTAALQRSSPGDAGGGPQGIPLASATPALLNTSWTSEAASPAARIWSTSVTSSRSETSRSSRRARSASGFRAVGVDLPHASGQERLRQCSPDAAVGARHQGDRSFDSLCVHRLFLSCDTDLVVVGHEIDLAPGIERWE